MSIQEQTNRAKYKDRDRDSVRDRETERKIDRQRDRDRECERGGKGECMYLLMQKAKKVFLKVLYIQI